MYSDKVASSPRPSAFLACCECAVSCVSVSSVILWSASHFRLHQPPKRRAGSSLLGFFLCAPLPRSQARAFSPNLYLKCLLMIRPTLRCKSILRRRLPATLQELLQCGFAVRFK